MCSRQSSRPQDVGDNYRDCSGAERGGARLSMHLIDCRPCPGGKSTFDVTKMHARHVRQ